ncbi:hypothetical protein Kpol_1058p11 [Vanderwaltozyma polyspora DSM 70294]|uniref:Enoyl reductase (ER) domain-containing protein n=1 Tax=Vanderwaltozyma polyspora (strain ATCC 22028 / DSM 70294 / BCRC 21397 / CBS 2163 / NBRC 10782 / NRRL Y-8283 / UCD 57-17) TaxID=436907 RepID=A7TJP5_VANPO|nr:uncharacterized protein Kpol_1058p11 [Vanderwaltozyma polyspora DSM 70294]EDO17474.1 hypothetical protein Kpol_1058p11 [Vanderwaltozyma polyspora DSM 70294]
MVATEQKAVILEEKGKIVFGNRPIPSIEDQHFVKVQIKATGICGSDVHFCTHGAIGSFIVKEPMVLGHESSGIVVEVGSEVTKVAVGDRVAIEPGYPSRYSEETVSGHYNLCPGMKFAATPPVDGTLLKYFQVPEDFVYKLPDDVTFEEGALVEPLAVAVHAVKLAGVKFGDKVVVFGAGPVGLLVGSVCKAFGATEVVSIDVVDKKLDKSLEMGSTIAINSKDMAEEALALEIQNDLNGQHPNKVIDCTGAEPCLRSSILACKPGGTVVQVGMGTTNASLPVSDIVIKELTFKGSMRYCHGDYQDAIQLLKYKKVDVKAIITHRFSFDDAIKALQFNISRDPSIVKTVIAGP